MKIELAPGEKITIVFSETDGSVEVEFNETGIVVQTDSPDDNGRSGVIYRETFDINEEDEEG